MSTAALAQTPTEPPPVNVPPVTEPPVTEPSATEPPPVPTPPPPPAAPTMAMVGKANEVMVGPDRWFKVGLQGQIWLDANESTAAGGGYSLNFLARRIRLIGSAQFSKKFRVFGIIDTPRAGLAVATSNGATPPVFTVSKGFTPALIQDFWGEANLVGEQLMLEAGLIIRPLSRATITSTTTYWTLDAANISSLNAAATGTSGTRDLGMQLKGYLLEDHLDYRVGLFSGLRQAPGTGTGEPVARNFFLTSAYLQYNFFDVEKAYVYAGQNFGKKKIVGVSAGLEYQQANGADDPYLGFSGAVFFDWPLAADYKAGADEIGGIAQFCFLDGGDSIAALAKQTGFLAELAYYNKGANASVFAKFEMNSISDMDVGNRQWIGAGIKYFVQLANLNFTLAWNRLDFPNDDAKSAGNEFTLQAQFFYY